MVVDTHINQLTSIVLFLSLFTVSYLLLEDISLIY